MSTARSFLIKAALLAAMGVGGIGALLFSISKQMATHNIEARGFAADYNELATKPVIQERLDYFPRAAKNIEYWCRPYSNGLNGSFDISEAAFLEWVSAMGWQLRELHPTELGPSIRVMHPDGSDEYVQRPKNGCFYVHQTFERPGQLSRDFQILFDKIRNRVYFSDSDGRTGLPSSD